MASALRILALAAALAPPRRRTRDAARDEPRSARALADRDLLWLGVTVHDPGSPNGRADFRSARRVAEPPALPLAALAAGLALGARRRVIG
jgi:hypothetical protein